MDDTLIQEVTDALEEYLADLGCEDGWADCVTSGRFPRWEAFGSSIEEITEQTSLGTRYLSKTRTHDIKVWLHAGEPDYLQAEHLYSDEAGGVPLHGAQQVASSAHVLDFVSARTGLPVRYSAYERYWGA